MSESMNITLERKVKNIKGKSSMSKPYLISFNKENILNSQNITKSNENDTPIKYNKEMKMSVKTVNNKSFVLRPKYRKVNHEKIDKILSKKLIYKSGNSFINNPKKISKNKQNIINDIKKSKNPFHARIKSFQIDFKDKFFANNLNKTERSTFYDERTLINKNKSKKNKINNEKEMFNKDYTISKNFYSNKSNNNFEDLEDNSTKNTKIFEQNVLTLDSMSLDEKMIILSDRNTKIEEENENKKGINCNINNKQKYKKINNISNKGKNTFRNSFYKKNRAFSPSLRNKLNNLRKNILTNKEQDKSEISSIINKNYETKHDFSKKRKIKIKKEKQNLKDIENKKKVSNLIQKIKDKIQSIQEIENKNNNTLNNFSKNFIKEKKTISNSNCFNPFQLNKSNNNINNNKKEKKNMNKEKSPISINKNNILYETNKNNREKNFTNIIQIKDHKPRFKNNININNIVRKDKINKKFIKKNIEIYDNESEFQKICMSSKSQNDVFTDFITKTLNKEEKCKEKNKANNKLSKEKSPKDFEDKKIESIENLCQKGFSGPGIKKINQDNFFIYNNFMNNPNYIFTGVCDGHGTFGHNVSGYLVYNLPLTINDILIKEKMEKLTEQNKPKLISIIKNTFLDIDKKISLDTRIDSLYSGSTCVSIVYTPSKLICANLGDSRCLIGKYDGKKWFSKNISYDHKPTNILEQERILKNGGRIESFKDEEGNYLGPKRVWLKDEDVPGLAMSRSFGDGVAHSVGVISEPEITEYSFLHEDKFIILASDGIWEFISSDECVNLVKDYYIKKDIIGALNFLYKEASKRWIIEEEVIDDITLIIIFFE